MSQGGWDVFCAADEACVHSVLPILGHLSAL